MNIRTPVINWGLSLIVLLPMPCWATSIFLNNFLKDSTVTVAPDFVERLIGSIDRDHFDQMFLDIASHLDGRVYGVMPGTSRVETTLADPNDLFTTFMSPLSEGVSEGISKGIVTVTVNRGVIPMVVSTPFPSVLQ